MNRILLIGGGARSGKSRFALERAMQLGTRRAFVATAEPLDDEMKLRVTRHQRERGADFKTFDAPLDLVECLARVDGLDVVVVDCLTFWLSNLLLRGETTDAILARVDALAAELLERRRHVLLVTNEVGMSLVPETPLGRVFRDLAGWTHQRLARVADEIYFGALGTMLRLRPAPILPMPTGDET